MYGCESWAINKAESQRIDAFKLWCWSRLLRVPWPAKTSNQSILKKLNSEYALEGLMLKLKFQYFGHLMWRTNSLEKTLMLGKIEARRRRGWQRMRQMDLGHQVGHEFEQTPADSEGQGSLACCISWSHKSSDMTEQLNSHNNNELYESFYWQYFFSNVVTSKYLKSKAGYSHMVEQVCFK